MTSSKDMSHAFNSRFISIGEKLAAEIPSSSLLPESFINRTNKTFTLKPTPINKTIKLLSKINERKATCLDKIPCKLLKMAANIVAPSLTQYLTNQFIQVSSQLTGSSLESPIFKRGDKTDMNNYRPISVISAVAKIFEKAIYDQLYEYLNENSLLSNFQSGFRSLHSTLTVLIEATNDWSINIDRGNLNGVVFIDLKRPFTQLITKLF